MSDSVTVTSRQSWFSRIGGAIAGVLFGLILLLVAFPLLIWNEGRAIDRAKTLDAGSKEVISVPASPVDPANEGKLVHVTGDAVVQGSVSDSLFGISAPAIKLRRNVEMYQWTQEEKSETKKNLGGSEETVTTYTYSKKWSGSLIDSSTFQKPDGHDNPSEMPVESATFASDEVSVGDFQLPESLVQMIDDYHALPVPKDAEVNFSEPVQIVNQGFYVGKNPKEPAVGDLKVTFEVVDPGAVSIIAGQTKDTFEPYQIKGHGTIELLQSGTFSAASMFASEQQGNAIITWLVRLGGFVMIFIGLTLILRPISVLADVIPLFGSLAEAGTGMVSLLVAIPLTVGTVALAWLAFRPLIGIPLLIVTVAGIYFAIRTVRARLKAKASPPPIPAA